jgi:hypothetical protein
MKQKIILTIGSQQTQSIEYDVNANQIRIKFQDNVTRDRFCKNLRLDQSSRSRKRSNYIYQPSELETGVDVTGQDMTHPLWSMSYMFTIPETAIKMIERAIVDRRKDITTLGDSTSPTLFNQALSPERPEELEKEFSKLWKEIKSSLEDARFLEANNHLLNGITVPDLYTELLTELNKIIFEFSGLEDFTFDDHLEFSEQLNARENPLKGFCLNPKLKGDGQAIIDKLTSISLKLEDKIDKNADLSDIPESPSAGANKLG